MKTKSHLSLFHTSSHFIDHFTEYLTRDQFSDICHIAPASTEDDTTRDDVLVEQAEISDIERIVDIDFDRSNAVPSLACME